MALRPAASPNGWRLLGPGPNGYEWVCAVCDQNGNVTMKEVTYASMPPTRDPCHPPAAKTNATASPPPNALKCDLRWQRWNGAADSDEFQCRRCGTTHVLASSAQTPVCSGYAKTLGSYPSVPPPGPVFMGPPQTAAGKFQQLNSLIDAGVFVPSVDEKLRAVFAPDPEPRRRAKAYPRCSKCERELSPTLDAYYGTDPAAKNQCVDCRSKDGHSKHRN